jgi:hypothetical protein
MIVTPLLKFNFGMAVTMPVVFHSRADRARAAPSLPIGAGGNHA